MPCRAPGAQNGAIDLDGRFGLHPALRSLQPLWEAGHLAIVHAAGSPDATRSHFDAQEYMESGAPGRKVDEGWLNRALPDNADQSGPMRAVAMGTELPLTLRGNRGAVAVDDLSRFQLGNAEAAAALEALYSSSRDAHLAAQGKRMFEALRVIDEMKRQPYTPAAGSQYIGEFGRRLQLVARLIKADVGVEVAFADIGGGITITTSGSSCHLCSMNSARRWRPSSSTWATGWTRSCSSPCRSSAAPSLKTATPAPITATAT